VKLEWNFSEIGGQLFFVPAGKQSPSYPETVNSFDWKNFYERLGGETFLEAAKESMRTQYDYVLIDSRTGVSDTAGICTVQMPDVMVVCYTLNNQSITGSAAVAAHVDKQRRQVPSNAPLRIFPVPMRIDSAEMSKLQRGREFSKVTFSPLLNSLSEVQKKLYWGEIEVPYVPYYAYGEVLATFSDETGRRNSILAAMERLCGYLTDGEVTRLEPIAEVDRQRILQRFESKIGVEELVNDAPMKRLFGEPDDLFAKLSQNEQDGARRVLMRVVRLAESDSPTPSARLAVGVNEFALSEQRILRKLISARLITSEKDPTTGEEKVQLANDALLEWPSLRNWIKENGRFLLWRQQLRARLGQWQRARDTDHLLREVQLREALEWRAADESSLSPSELDFIDRSARGGALPIWRYKAFLSYDYSDTPLAKALAREVNGLVSNLFRDKASLFDSAANLPTHSNVPPDVREALRDSEYLVLLASPETASSQQVLYQLEAWLRKRPPENLLMILTAGEIIWDGLNKDFDWSATTAVPTVLTKIFRETPLCADLKWTKRGEDLLLWDPRFRQEVARLTASVYGRPVDELLREDTLRRRKRRFLGLSATVVGLTLLLSAILAFSTFRAMRDRKAVETAKSEATQWKTLAEERQKKIDELSRDLKGSGAKKQPEQARKELDEALKIYEPFVEQDPQRFFADVTRIKKLLQEIPR